MVRSLILTGINPLVSIETEPFGLNHHETRRLSMLISSLLIEVGDQQACGCHLINETSGNGRCAHKFNNNTVFSQGFDVEVATLEVRVANTKYMY